MLCLHMHGQFKCALDHAGVHRFCIYWEEVPKVNHWDLTQFLCALSAFCSTCKPVYLSVVLEVCRVL